MAQSQSISPEKLHKQMHRSERHLAQLSGVPDLFDIEKINDRVAKEMNGHAARTKEIVGLELAARDRVIH